MGSNAGKATPEHARAAGATASILMRSHSREQEFEADQLAIAMMTRANYDPNGLKRFMSKILANERLLFKIVDRPEHSDRLEFLNTHPSTEDRIEKVEATIGAGAEPAALDNTFLARFDGLRYDESPEDGYLLAGTFYHPRIGIAFTLPEGFKTPMIASRILLGPAETDIIFEVVNDATERSVVSHLTKEWAPSVTFDKVDQLRVGGFEAAAGRAAPTILERRTELRMLAIHLKDGALFRFTFGSPAENTVSLDQAFQQIVATFRAIDAGEADGYRPLRIDVVTPGAGDTVESLADRMPFADFREERFRVLNGLVAGEALTPGRPVKLVVE